MNQNDWVIVKKETFEARANLMVSVLNQENIDAYITNDTMATMLPIQNSGYIVRVRERDLIAAQEIIADFEGKINTRVEEDFRDADKDDIEYQKELIENEEIVGKANSTQLLYLLFVVILGLSIAAVCFHFKIY